MSQSLGEIAQHLHGENKKVQLIYAFNGTGKTRLSREFKDLIEPEIEEEEGQSLAKVLYYNAFTEDLFYWHNDSSTLKIQPNDFTSLILEDLGQDQNVITHFQRYTNEQLTPEFDHTYIEPSDHDDTPSGIPFTGVKFSYQRGNEEHNDGIKISKGEESNFIWSIFYSITEQAVDNLNEEVSYRSTDKFDDLQYIFIDDPVSSLDENHLIELAVDIASLIKRSDFNNGLKFVITTHNPLFYNVLWNEFSNAGKYVLNKSDNDSYQLTPQRDDSPFSYHLYLKDALEAAITSGDIRKYHFNFLRNILEKTSTFFGYAKWADLLPEVDGDIPNPYEVRMVNLLSHSMHAAQEVAELHDDDKRMLRYLFERVKRMYDVNDRANQIASN